MKRILHKLLYEKVITCYVVHKKLMRFYGNFNFQMNVQHFSQGVKLIGNHRGKIKLIDVDAGTMKMYC